MRAGQKGEVSSVAAATETFLKLQEELVGTDEKGEVWCRGHSGLDWQLVPGLFREERGVYDETAMFHSFRVRAPERHHDHRSVFDWLCLMQHYEAPTRLLDWTENFLFALYFAVLPEGGECGRVMILAPKLLNREVIQAETIAVSDGFHVAVRSVQARARDYSGWAREVAALECFPSSIDAHKCTAIDPYEPSQLVEPWLRDPVAVRPHRFNQRIVAQVGTFTLHAGKRYDSKSRTPAGDRLPEPRHRFDLDDPASKAFLRHFTVQKGAIRKELERMGIHHGTLYPELDGQTAFLVNKWLIDRPPEKSAAQLEPVELGAGETE
jgi:hypothetical protein